MVYSAMYSNLGSPNQTLLDATQSLEFIAGVPVAAPRFADLVGQPSEAFAQTYAGQGQQPVGAYYNALVSGLVNFHIIPGGLDLSQLNRQIERCQPYVDAGRGVVKAIGLFQNQAQVAGQPKFFPSIDAQITEFPVDDPQFNYAQASMDRQASQGRSTNALLFVVPEVTDLMFWFAAMCTKVEANTDDTILKVPVTVLVSRERSYTFVSRDSGAYNDPILYRLPSGDTPHHLMKVIVPNWLRLAGSIRSNTDTVIAELDRLEQLRTSGQYNWKRLFPIAERGQTSRQTLNHYKIATLMSNQNDNSRRVYRVI